MSTPQNTGLFSRLLAWRYTSPLLSGVAILSGLLTYLGISYGGTSLSDRTGIIIPFIAVDVCIIILLSFIIGLRIRDVFLEQKRGEVGARLHIIILSSFSIVTITPSLLMGILAMTFFRSSVAIWFSRPVQNTLNEAGLVAELCLEEHKKNIRLDLYEFAEKLKSLFIECNVFDEKNENKIRENLDQWVDEQKLEEAFVNITDKNNGRDINLRSSMSFTLPTLISQFTPSEALREDHGTVIACIPFDDELHGYTVDLWINKGIDQKIVKYVTSARNSAAYYNELLGSQQNFQLIIIVLFVLSSILLLLGAIWLGLSLANVLVIPITQLISAADSVSKGNLTVRIPELPAKNELAKLVTSFNRMVERLEQQNRDLIISEKKSAWSDIARKIAHEVKNPLTPIQLSAERLKRKYNREIRSDPETFNKCIDTIIRQVAHIENLISEFSAFARMPEPDIQPTNVLQLAKDVVFMQQQAYPMITFLVDSAHPHIIWECDAQQIHQVLINLIQNSVNAILESGSGERGCIRVGLRRSAEALHIVVEDNGPGFPRENRERLFEPYYTTRSKGTGLGMAIVLRIITEHDGYLELKDAAGHPGARVEVALPHISIGGTPFAGTSCITKST